MRATIPWVSERRVCTLLSVARCGLRRRVIADRPRCRRLDSELVERIWLVIERYPTFGYRRVWAILRYRA